MHDLTPTDRIVIRRALHTHKAEIERMMRHHIGGYTKPRKDECSVIDRLLVLFDSNEERTRIRWGFKGRNQLPLFMVWRECYDDRGEVDFAYVLFNSLDWIKL